VLITITARLTKQTKAERCFSNQQLGIAFHIFVKLVEQTRSPQHNIAMQIATFG